MAELPMAGTQVGLLSGAFLTLCRLSYARKVTLDVVRFLLSNEQLGCVRVDNGTIELHDIVANFSFCHLASD